MRDGLYQVTWGGVCAGFVVEGGQVTQQAPILRARGMAGQVRRVDDFYRVPFTGSRDYASRRDPDRDEHRDRAAVRQDLTKVLQKFGCRPDQLVVVEGEADGLDSAARDAAEKLGMRVEKHPVHKADWERYGPSAGHRRNAVMVASVTRRGAAGRGVVAYPVGASRGTRGCMAMAENTPELKGKVWNRTDPPASGLGKR